MKRLHKSVRIIVYSLLLLFILMNVIAFSHAYKFTHFTNDVVVKTTSIENLNVFSKVKLLVFGIDNPRPKHTKVPTRPYETITLQGEKKIECWRIKSKVNRGTVLLFHGYNGEKSSLLNKADVFLELGYHVLLVDFAGSGGSEGNVTTIGFKEAEQVKRCVEYISNNTQGEIILFGTSMGAVAIMKSLHDNFLPVTKVILECPFATMQETVEARFRMMNVPSFPMAHLLVFWGGIQNGYWAFDHNPETYAKKIHCPVMLMHGSKDPKVSEDEIDRIYLALNTQKKLVKFDQAGHEDYLKFGTKWKDSINDFLVEFKAH